MKVSKIGLFGVFSVAVALAGAPANAQDNGAGPNYDMAQVIETYVNIGFASYNDAVHTAELLRTAIEDLLNNPTEENLDLARQAWQTARLPYEQSDIFVHVSPTVADWTDRVNAWPVNVDYIDTISTRQNVTPQIIANEFHHAGGNADNVASGYHVIEYLLWGRDTSGNEIKGVKEGAGQRPATDYSLENCSLEGCAQRGEYLYAAANLLIDDLDEMASRWSVTGDVRRALIANPAEGVAMLIEGLGSAAYGDLAGRRLLRAVQSHDPNLELDPFSNNSHITYLFNTRGMVSIYFGEFFSSENKLTTGISLADLVAQTDPDLDEEFRVALGETMARTRLMIEHARDDEAFDVMISQDNEEGNNLIFATIDALVDQTEILGRMFAALDLPPRTFVGDAALDEYVASRK